jgi:hypothetical protein
MFNSLEGDFKRDDQAASTPRQRWLRYAAVLLVSLLAFGGLYFGIRFLEG